MSKVKLERPIRYGNVGAAYDPARPADDEYLFKPENTRDLWAHARQITDRYGYELRFDEHGNVLLAARNRPHVMVDLTTAMVGGSATEVTAPNAYGGTYLQWTGNVSQFDVNVTGGINAARIDLVFPRGTLGAWTVTVLQGATPVAGPLTIDPSAPLDLHYYDADATVVGDANATVVTLYSGYYNTYTVRLASTGGTVGTIRRLDALQLWHTDPSKPLLPVALATTQNADDVQALNTMDEMRNHVIVVGRRQATVTDSAKLDTQEEQEFVVERAVDVRSIVHPFNTDGTTPNPNYIGIPKESVIYDTDIADNEFAAYLARTFIYRYRLPKPSAQISHSLLPVVQLRDPVYASEDTFETLTSSQVLYVTGITHRVTPESARTEFTTAAYPEYPSFERREDVDIDAKFNGSPIANVTISYTSLSGHAQSNLADGLAKLSTGAGSNDWVTVRNKTVSNNVIDMSGAPWPPVPGTVFLEPAGTGAPTVSTATKTSNITATTGWAREVVSVPHDSKYNLLVQLGFTRTTGYAGQVNTTTVTLKPYFNTGDPAYYTFNSRTSEVTVYMQPPSWLQANGYPSTAQIRIIYYPVTVSGSAQGWLTNNPYHHLFNVDFRDSNRTLTLLWKHGDGSQAFARNVSTFNVHYRKLGPVDGGNAFSNPYASNNVPFYDPYTSELGYLVTTKFDALVSGRYRISVRSVYDDQVVAWLTEPTGDPTDADTHWTYYTAGANKTLLWDGVDQVGEWNKRQSATYAEAAFGSFEVERAPYVGKGFYVWNREERTTQEPQIALISGERDANGVPVFGQGTFAEWYVKFEVENENLLELDEARSASGQNPQMDGRVLGRRVVNSTAMNWGTGAVSARVYTHLPKPTQVKLTYADWVGPAGYDPTDVDATNRATNWATGQAAWTGNPDGLINNQRPVRMRFAVQPRPGTLWSGKQDEVSVKLMRHVHLRANLADQFVQFNGINYPGTSIEERKIVNRRLTNDDHTIVFEDSQYRKASSFKTSDAGTGFEWIFRPDDFRKDWRGDPDEPIKFGDYLQLEEVPGWTTDKSVAGARARFQIAFMNYLFYLSAYTQDRSGRFQWCINTAFVDRSKILQNEAADWADPTNPTSWPDDPTTQFRRTILTRQWSDERINGQRYADYMNTTWSLGGTSSVGYWLCQHYWRDHDYTRTTLGQSSLGAGIAWPTLDLDRYSQTHAAWSTLQAGGGLPASWPVNRQLGTSGSTRLGTWTWQTQGVIWVPCVTRDFHPYYCVPAMAEKLGYSNETGLRSSTSTPYDAMSLWSPYDWINDYCYAVVDYRGYTGDSDDENGNMGDDVAAATVWNSPIKDMSQTSVTRFYPGRVVTPDKEPTKKLTAADADYLRQDDMVHYEDLRGTFSRGPRPEEQPKRVSPVGPYYQNLYKYNGFVTVKFRKQSPRSYPNIRADVALGGWFDHTFRLEYVWESARLFPTTLYGKEQLAGMNATIARAPAVDIAQVYYDDGAWTGWKDDSSGQLLLYDNRSDDDDTKVNVFATNFMPVAVGPTLLTTRNALFHLTLVPSRRQG